MKNAAAIIFLTALAACGGGAKNEAGGGNGGITIAVIPKGTSHVFWQSIHAGAQKAATDLGVTIVWRGPLREDDRDAQVSEVEGFISRGISGICLAPLDETALVPPVQEAVRQKIPVVIFDSGLKSSDYVSFVATDNTKGGQLGGERLAQSIGKKGKVILLRYAEGHDSTGKREQGFLDAMKQYPGIDVVSSNQYGGADVEGAYKKAEALLSTYKKPDGSLGVDGIFTPNESVSFAMLRVLQDNGWAGKVKFVGFDASPNLVKGLRDGGLDAIVVQDPVHMGYTAVDTMVKHLKGQAVEKWIDTGVQVATKDNMDTPQIKSLIEPNLSNLK
ncbi:MAG TPA: substrate-binding domain-containing protein [Vicinamibacterales bacterium]|jgi:ribose transport system substrate-binding protein|nr:substrate-binding domain-containing protein [Vicinamibacterales bacterium]